MTKPGCMQASAAVSAGTLCGTSSVQDNCERLSVSHASVLTVHRQGKTTEIVQRVDQMKT